MIQKIRKISKGFTLIELVIVMAIIAILCSVFIPQLIKYRNNKLQVEQPKMNREITIYKAIPDDIPKIKPRPTPGIENGENKKL